MAWRCIAFAAGRVDVRETEVVKCCTMPASVCDSGMRKSNRTLPEYSPYAVRAVMYRRMM